ncbi:MAG: hypothetical protein JW889_11120 [Verrucomicrobia bacterium]|nr:hypothetical protein [Verrucomicrobiota bacterium]
MSDALRHSNGRLLDDRTTVPVGEEALNEKPLFQRCGPTYEAGTLVLVPTWGPEWFASALDGIWRVASLRSDWDGEGSPPPSPVAVGTAVRLLQGLVHYDLPSPFVCPLREGGLQIEWQRYGRELEVEFWDAEEVGYLKVRVDGSTEEGQCPAFDLHTFRELAEWLNEESDPGNP